MNVNYTSHKNSKQQVKTSLFALVFLTAGFVFTSSVKASPDLPIGEQVEHGDADITRDGDTLTIDQHTVQVIINWEDFSVGKDNTVNFLQEASDVALNRVIADNPSFIYGNVNADGHVFLVNQSGILFSTSSRVDAAGLLASTLDISDEDFLSGNYTFSGDGGSVINQGTINIRDGGYAALLGEQAIHEGLISADLGTVALG